MVSCSCFAPTPSMAACLVNKFGMRKDVLTYQLAGMGCSSSLVCIDMVKRLLKVQLQPAHPCASSAAETLHKRLHPTFKTLMQRSWVTLGCAGIRCSKKACM